MKKLNTLLLVFVSLAGASLHASEVDVAEIIDRARFSVGHPDDLDGLVTLRMMGRLEPSDPKVPAATIAILARKPNSQRLEIRVDDLVETTILNGKQGCMIRSNLESDASQMRGLTKDEYERVLYTTRQFFNFYKPDEQNGEVVTYGGQVEHRGILSHKLRYSHPNGFETIRFFSVEQDFLVAVISENGVESLNVGSQVEGGIEYPEQIDYFEGGRKLHSVVFTEIEVNQPLEPGIFKIPNPQAKKTQK